MHLACKILLHSWQLIKAIEFKAEIVERRRRKHIRRRRAKRRADVSKAKGIPPGLAISVGIPPGLTTCVEQAEEMRRRMITQWRSDAEEEQAEEEAAEHDDK